MVRQCCVEGRRAESGRVVHVALELDAQDSGRGAELDGREVYIIINVIKISKVRTIGRKIRGSKMAL